MQKRLTSCLWRMRKEFAEVRKLAELGVRKALETFSNSSTAGKVWCQLVSRKIIKGEQQPSGGGSGCQFGRGS